MDPVANQVRSEQVPLVDSLGFTSERLSKTKAFMRQLWSLDRVHRPGVLLSHFVEGELKPSARELVENPELSLQKQLSDFRSQAKYIDDNVPCLMPPTGVDSVSSAFGYEVRFTSGPSGVIEGGVSWGRPIIKSPEQVFSIAPPPVYGGLLGRALEHTRYYEQKTGGTLPIRICDLQGPLSITSRLWGESELIYAIRDHPQAVHCLLDLISDLLIRFIREWINIPSQPVLNSVPLIWSPSPGFPSVGEDVCVWMSPDLYAEFGIPYINRLSEAFGGVAFHSCGDFSHQIENIKSIVGLRAINFGANEMPVEVICRAFRGRALIVPHFGAGAFTGSWRYDTMHQYFSSVASVAGEGAPIFVLVRKWIDREGTRIPQDLKSIVDYLASKWPQDFLV